MTWCVASATDSNVADRERDIDGSSMKGVPYPGPNVGLDITAQPEIRQEVHNLVVDPALPKISEPKLGGWIGEDIGATADRLQDSSLDLVGRHLVRRLKVDNSTCLGMRTAVVAETR